MDVETLDKKLMQYDQAFSPRRDMDDKENKMIMDTLSHLTFEEYYEFFLSVKGMGDGLVGGEPVPSEYKLHEEHPSIVLGELQLGYLKDCVVVADIWYSSFESHPEQRPCERIEVGISLFQKNAKFRHGIEFEKYDSIWLGGQGNAPQDAEQRQAWKDNALSTLELLKNAAADPELNPTLSPRILAHYPDLKPAA